MKIEQSFKDPLSPYLRVKSLDRLEYMFLVNVYIISRPAELDCFECEKGEKIPDETFIGNFVFKRRRIHPFSRI